jgi:cathepsin B
MCIASNASLELPLSAEDVCFCANPNGCAGGSLLAPWTYIQKTGAVSGGQYHGTGPFGKGMCSDFSLPHCHHHGPQGKDPYPKEMTKGCPLSKSPACPTKCDAAATEGHTDFQHDKYSFKGEVVTASGETAIQQLIMAGGPVSTAFTVYVDFEDYAGGVYHHVTGGAAGGHAVKFTGWGVDNGVKYWKVANSWNQYWGENGYFRIRRGDGCDIESQVISSDTKAIWGKKNAFDEVVV